jgi:uncharacterized protein (DUF362 family)
MVEVSIVRSERPDVKRSLDLIGFTPGDYEFIAIKPNLCSPLPYYSGATTDLRLLEEVIKIFQGNAKEMVVIEGNGYSATADEAAETSGVMDVCNYFEVPFVNLSSDILVPVKGDLKALQNVKLPRTYLKADFLINLPVMKTHTKLSEAICDVLRVRKPDLNILDGIIGMEGDGPIEGRPKKMDLVLAGTDVLALDIIACRVMRINPAYVDHIQKAAYYGLGEGNPSKIDVFGERVEDVWERFTT